MERRYSIWRRGERNSYRFKSCPDYKNKNMKEILIYGIGFVIALFLTLALTGTFDNDPDNPWKKK